MNSKRRHYIGFTDLHEVNATSETSLHGRLVIGGYLCATQLKDTHWTVVEMQLDSGGADIGVVTDLHASRQ